MMFNRRLTLAASCTIASAALLAGCASSAHDATTADARATEQTPPANTNETTFAGPMNDKDRMRQQEWLDATRHLVLDRTDGLLGVQALSIGESSPESYAQFMLDGQELMNSNRYVPALGAFAEAARHNNAAPEPWIAIANALLPKAKLDLLDRALNTALDRDADNIDALVMKADLLWTRGLHNDAITAMQAVTNAHPSLGPAHARLARWYYYTNNDAAAWTHIHAAEELGTSVPAQLRMHLENRSPDKD